MKNLYLRIYATVVLVLLFFATASGWVFQRHMEQERIRAESVFAERMSAQAELIQRSLPGVDAAPGDQADALREWSERLRLPLALDSPDGKRIAASETFEQRQEDGVVRALAVGLEDGRTLWIMRPSMRGPGVIGPRLSLDGPGTGNRRLQPDDFPPIVPFLPPGLQGIGVVIVLVLLFFAVAAGAWPVVRRLTRRLEVLKLGVEQFGAGELSHRLDVSGKDEVAALASSFNVAAARIEALVQSHRSLLANASHELRSPLARMKMAVSLLVEASPQARERLKEEIDTNVGELDALVEEVLLASRLGAEPGAPPDDAVDLLAVAAEEAARVDAAVKGSEIVIRGDERLLRRALRNLLENARRYGGAEVSVSVEPDANGGASVCVCDRGPGVPEAMRERIFEPFFRLPGHAEQAGGVGLGLSLVKQIAERHGGSVRCEAHAGGGSCFELDLPGRA